MIADSVTGSSIADEFRRRFWTPLALESVFLASGEEPGGTLASVWTQGDEGGLQSVGPFEVPVVRETGWGAYGLKSNTRDMALWGHALFQGEILNASTIAEMLTEVPPPGSGADVAVGLGVRKYNFAGTGDTWGHSGVTPDGSALLLHDLDSKITVVVAVNQDPRTHRGVQYKTAAALLIMARSADVGGD